MLDLATADMRLRSARAGLLELLNEAWTLAANDLHIDRCLQARTLLAIHQISEVATDATSTAHRLAGGQAAYNDSRILRALRDVQTARQHMLFARGLATRLAPIATGIDEAAPPFVL
jgi:alkylation response protein AidB-like acyl-CoA dehydrogenase